MLVRTSFLEGKGRYERLFKDNPPNIVAVFTERVPMVKGRLDRKASSATSYSWLVWQKSLWFGSRCMWVPPCRKELERDSDYPQIVQPKTPPINFAAWENNESDD